MQQLIEAEEKVAHVFAYLVAESQSSTIIADFCSKSLSGYDKTVCGACHTIP